MAEHHLLPKSTVRSRRSDREFLPARNGFCGFVFFLGGYHRAMNKRLTKICKYLTFILRHEPQSIGLKLDADGFASVEELVAAANASGKSVTEEQIREVVQSDEMQLFKFNDDETRVAAKPKEPRSAAKSPYARKSMTSKPSSSKPSSSQASAAKTGRPKNPWGR